MIKIFCDICKKEPKEPDFVCEMQVSEVITGISSANFKEQRHLEKNLFQFCKDCYTKKVVPLFEK